MHVDLAYQMRSSLLRSQLRQPSPHPFPRVPRDVMPVENPLATERT